MKKLITFTLILSLLFVGCSENNFPPDNTVPESASTDQIESAEQNRPKSESYIGKDGATYSYNREEYPNCNITVNGHTCNVNFPQSEHEVHFLIDGNRLYAVGICYDVESTYRLYSGNLSDNRVTLEVSERYTDKDVRSIAEMFEKLKKMSPNWENPTDKRTDFIVCGAFINEHCYDMTDEECKLLADSFSVSLEDDEDKNERLQKAQEKSEVVFGDYRLFITPQNAEDLVRLDKAAVKSLICYLSEDGINLSALNNIREYCVQDSFHIPQSTVAVIGTPMENEFYEMIDRISNFHGNLSIFSGNYSDGALEVYDSDIVFDTHAFPYSVYFTNCNISVNQQLKGSAYNLGFVNCKFDKIPDFSGISLFTGYSNPFGSFYFDCPNQKATGITKIKIDSEPYLYVCGDIDFEDFSFIKDTSQFHFNAFHIKSTGVVNIEDLLENDYEGFLNKITLEDCITKGQYRLLSNRYPNDEIIAIIDGKEYKNFD